MNSEKADNSILGRTELLSALDYEIETIEKEHSSPGWTKWTFYGGFASIVWVGISEISEGKFKTSNALLILLIFSMLFDIVKPLLSVLKTNKIRPATANRLKLASQELSGSRHAMVGDAVRVVALLTAYYFLNRPSVHFTSNWFLIYYSFSLLFAFIVLVLSFFGLPVIPRKNSSFPAWQLCIGFAIVAVPPMVAFYQSTITLFVIQDSLTASDIRLGLLGAGFLWLMRLFLEYLTENEPLLESLKNIRRDLAFDRIAVNDALRQADIAIDGMKVDDYFHEDLKKILYHLDLASKSMHQLGERMQEANSLIKAVQGGKFVAEESGVDPSKMIIAIMQACDLHRNNIKESLQAARSAQDLYWRKKSFIKTWVAESELSRIDDNIRSFVDKLRQPSVAIDIEEKAFNENVRSVAIKLGLPDFPPKSPPTNPGN